MKICMAQINTLVGDIAANAQRVIDVCLAQAATGARLIVFPELTLTGYPPEDLLLRGDLLTRTERALQHVVASCPPELMVVVGYPRAREGQLFNTAGVIREGRVVAEYDKQCLPNYQVFDEKRYFSAGDSPCVVSFKDIQFGLTICEDIWHPEPAALSKAAGAQVLLNLNASPFHRGKQAERVAQVAACARDNELAVLYVNQVGGQDELVFDGGSFAVGADGEICVQAESFEESCVGVVVDAARQGLLVPGHAV